MSSLSSDISCSVCSNKDNLLRCSRCKLVYYCSKEHQKKDWKKHKAQCHIPSTTTRTTTTNINSTSTENKNELDKDYVHTIEQGAFKGPLPDEGSSESIILTSQTESLSPNLDFERSSTEKALRSAKSAMPISGENIVRPQKTGVKDFPEISFINKQINSTNYYPKNSQGIDEICRNVIRDMDAYGLCLVDNFLGEEKCKEVLTEVYDMYSKGVFKDGQLVSDKVKGDLKTIRSDQITWIDGREKHCSNIGYLISQVDAIIVRANKMKNNGKLGQYNINGRTKAMVACYPGSGSHYVKHVDNPNRDGRCITAIYYLNFGWDVKRDGGLLRIFPEGWLGDKVADIEPIFDRLLFFWSDRRNPHEVQPAYRTRYAITLWYFDSVEREEACRRYEKINQTPS